MCIIDLLYPYYKSKLCYPITMPMRIARFHTRCQEGIAGQGELKRDRVLRCYIGQDQRRKCFYDAAIG
uniref:Uncharacterized protein n=1 Tax=Setaria italica TaxID=4555 RepID=K4AHP5_SETIT